MTIGERLARLIDVKSLVTLALVGVLCGMTVCGGQTSEIFDSAVMLVLGFFFGKQKSGGEQAVGQTVHQENQEDTEQEMAGNKAVENNYDAAENIKENIKDDGREG